MVSNIASLFRSEPEETPENDKLYDLYWNRAELKKEFSALRNEKYELQNRLKEQQGETARVQQQIQHVENLLQDRDWAFNVVAFYQLRRLHTHCHNMLFRFGEQLKQQREKRVHRQVVDDWTSRRDSEAAVLETRLGELRIQTQRFEDQLQLQRQKLAKMNSLMKLLYGRSLESGNDDLIGRIEAGHIRERVILEELDRLRHQTPPDHHGLDKATKRSINFMILSFLQQLYLTYEDHGSARLAKEASEKSVGAVNYGEKADCDAIVLHLEQQYEQAAVTKESPEIIKQRAKMIAARAVFADDADAVPVAESVATVFSIDADGVIRESQADLLGDNYFAIKQVLSQ